MVFLMSFWPAPGCRRGFSHAATVAFAGRAGNGGVQRRGVGLAGLGGEQSVANDHVALTFVSGTELQAAIPASDIANAGTAQVTVFNPSPGGGVSNTLTFTVENNPVPSLNSLTPARVRAGSAGFALTLNGAGFVGSSVVRWNGSDRAAVFISSSELQASLLAADVATAGSAEVTVVNPEPGGGASNALTFVILGAIERVSVANDGSQANCPLPPYLCETLAWEQ